MKNLNPEVYKGYSIRFIEKIVGPKKYVEGGYQSKVTSKIVKVRELSKQMTYNKIKLMIDFEDSKKRLQRLK